ncbi:flagellar protein FliO/FliZ [Nocardioides sp. J9]|uniref:flagellar biosynthetic protein FliO n=1 Tax=unclassified Nocardioides TaxID=2615069 RepID=UPI0004B3CA95|nr:MULTISPECIES: flagellar biosynthetic protein FliO [unclassified Nocardioides]TWG98609.1 flagellar protein FliO/FliZ [Nocardioides sp. J9]
MLALSAADPSIGGLLLRLLGSLAVVVGLLLLIARFAGRRFRTPAGAPVQVVHRQALGRGQGVAVVAVGTRVLVLGTTEQQVTLLAEVEPDEVGIDLTAEPFAVVPHEDGDAEGDADGDAEPVTGPRGFTVPAAQGALAGSLLSAQTWKQTWAAVSGKRAS